MSFANLLVVEDEAVVALHLEQSLTKLGYAVAVAYSGDEALEQAVTKRPDLALMDIRLSGSVDGIAAAERLRKCWGVPSVYLTAYADEETIERARATEPAGYLMKPFREQELHATIQMALFRASVERRLQQEQTWHLALLESLCDAVISTDTQGRVRFLNRAAQTMTGCGADEAVGKHVLDLLSALGEGRGTVQACMGKALEEGVSVRFPPGLLLESGQVRETFQAESVTPVQEDTGALGGVVLVFRACPRAPAEESAAKSVVTWVESAISAPSRKDTATAAPPPSTDPLTGLPARAEAELALTQALQGNRRAFAAAFAVDRYGAIEGRYGRSAAEDVLLFYSIHLAQGLAAGDQLFRWSDAAFLVLMERLDQAEAVRREVARLASVRLEKLLHVRSRTALVVVSAAATVFPVTASSGMGQLSSLIDAFVKSRGA